MKDICDKCGFVWDNSVKGTSTLSVELYNGSVFSSTRVFKLCVTCTKELMENLGKGEINNA